MLFALGVLLLSSIYYYTQSFKHALNAKRWAVAGLIAGPLLLPLFNVKKRMAYRKVTCFHNIFLQA
ncbi:hypothetical protein QX776_14990 [Alteromonadaceae bacterium BrNp21-10]|nr:hypothetical protein [Alteromonadaceae bacterium BrNp21-10]